MRKAKLPQATALLRTAMRQLPLLAALLLIFPLLASCEDDHIEIGKAPISKIRTSYWITISDDVLEYVEPVVTYSTPSGETKIVSLTKEMMSEGALDIPGLFKTNEGIIDPDGLYSWHPEVLEHNTADNMTSTIKVTFREKKDVPDIDREYNYLASLGWSCETTWKIDKKQYSSQRQNSPDLKVAKVGRDTFISSIDKLTDTTLVVTVKVEDNIVIVVDMDATISLSYNDEPDLDE